MGETEDGWMVEGEDAFDGTTYGLGRHATEQAALVAALDRLRKLEGSQPTASSGGQDGIQDRVYVTGPDGMRRRILRMGAGDERHAGAQRAWMGTEVESRAPDPVDGLLWDDYRKGLAEWGMTLVTIVRTHPGTDVWMDRAGEHLRVCRSLVRTVEGLAWSGDVRPYAEGPPAAALSIAALRLRSEGWSEGLPATWRASQRSIDLLEGARGLYEHGIMEGAEFPSGELAIAMYRYVRMQLDMLATGNRQMVAGIDGLEELALDPSAAGVLVWDELWTAYIVAMSRWERTFVALLTPDPTLPALVAHLFAAREATLPWSALVAFGDRRPRGEDLQTGRARLTMAAMTAARIPGILELPDDGGVDEAIAGVTMDDGLRDSVVRYVRLQLGEFAESPGTESLLPPMEARQILAILANGGSLRYYFKSNRILVHDAAGMPCENVPCSIASLCFLKKHLLIRPGECVDCPSGEPGQDWRLNMRSMRCDRGRGES